MRIGVKLVSRDSDLTPIVLRVRLDLGGLPHTFDDYYDSMCSENVDRCSYGWLAYPSCITETAANPHEALLL